MTTDAEPARSWDRDTLPEGEEKVVAVRQMFDAIAPRYDLVNRVMTFRLDTRWRKRAIRLLALAPGSTVIDLAAGTGDLCVDLRTAGHHPLAFDLSFGMLAADRSGSAERSHLGIGSVAVQQVAPSAGSSRSTR